MDVISYAKAKKAQDSVDKLALKQAKFDKELQQHKSTMVGINVNQEARQTAGGRRVVSLPKTAGEGHGEFGLKGLTATNLIKGRAVQQQALVSFDITSGNQYYDNFNKVITVGNDTTHTITNDTEKEVNILAVNLTQTFGAGNEPTKEECDIIFANYFEGTQSVNGNVRVKSVGKNLFDWEKANNPNDWNIDNISEKLTSKDGYLVGKSRTTYFKPINVIRNTDYTLSALVFIKDSLGGANMYDTLRIVDEDANELSSVSANNNPAVRSSAFNTGDNDIVYVRVQVVNASNMEAWFKDIQLEPGSTPTPYEPYTESTHYLNASKLRSLPNGVKDEIVGDTLVKRVSDIGEGLAEPEIIQLHPSGNLITRPSGTVYIEDVVADVATYSDKAEIGRSELLIKEIDKLSVMDFNTGDERNLDVSKIIISADGLSFTHPELTNGDIVFFEYYYTEESTDGLASVEYFDSRYTIKDSVTDKHYKWSVSIADGVPSIELEEV